MSDDRSISDHPSDIGKYCEVYLSKMFVVHGFQKVFMESNNNINHFAI